MDFFNYKDGKLFCEDVDLSLISDAFNTPAYVYSKKTLERHADAYLKSFSSSNNLVCFAVKSLSNISILKILKDRGCGFDIVSGGELHRVLLAGADPKKIIFSGVGKTKEEIASGIKNNVLSFNIESPSELYRIERVAKDLMFCKKISAHSVVEGSASESEGSESELSEPDSDSIPVGASNGGSSDCGACISVGSGFEMRFAHSSAIQGRRCWRSA